MQDRSVEAAIGEARRLAGLVDAEEGLHLQEACDIILPLLPRLAPAMRPAAVRILWRAGLYEEAASLGGLASLGREAAQHNQGSELLNLLARVETDADRLEVLAQHRLWAERLEQEAAARPLEPRPRKEREGPLRLGFLSSDLRHHVVAYFAHPLFQNLDPRFALYVYSSHRGPPDEAQGWIASRCAAYRSLPPDDRDAAEVVAADDLDLLLDLGGPTGVNRPGVLAFRPAPRQASWLGYPHSLGLSGVDGFVTDPHVAPDRPEFLLERPLLMPASWIAMTPAAFQPQPALQPEAPVLRNGFITFGTANATYKLSPRLIRVWAEILAATPGSRFIIIRPEAAAPAFRASFARLMGEVGITADRIEFRGVRGPVRATYGEIDIALDTFPLTGGTTTCEALWMGVPTVSLVGPAPYERLSFSILSNVGLRELCATTVEGYIRIALELAAAPARVAELRRGMRERVAASPLGAYREFARAFYDLMARYIGEGAAQAR